MSDLYGGLSAAKVDGSAATGRLCGTRGCRGWRSCCTELARVSRELDLAVLALSLVAGDGVVCEEECVWRLLAVTLSGMVVKTGAKGFKEKRGVVGGEQVDARMR